MARSPRELSEQAQGALDRLRVALATLEDVEETATYGNPTFRVNGKSFAVLDFYEGRYCVWMLVEAMERDARLTMPGWFPSPYDPRKAALCCELDALDWRRAKAFLRSSYQLARLAKRARKRGK